MKKIIFFIVFIFLGIYFFSDVSLDSFVIYESEKESSVVFDNGNIEIYFCPSDDCSSKLVDFIYSKVDCAFYELELENVIDKLLLFDSRIVIDEKYEEEILSSGLNYKVDGRAPYMHNKFCVSEDSVFTGSFNPTENGDTKNNNNVVIIHSSEIAKNFQDEFDSFWDGNFGKDSEVLIPAVDLDGILVENYFCPEDNCRERVIRSLDKASEEILFMTFSFTDDSVGDVLVQKFDDGVLVKGLFEKMQGSSSYSEYNKLLDKGIDVRFDSNPNMMHHKVFIIDRSIVITGSANPSNNGFDRNDENLIIIHSPEIASAFVSEFERLF